MKLPLTSSLILLSILGTSLARPADTGTGANASPVLARRAADSATNSSSTAPSTTTNVSEVANNNSSSSATIPTSTNLVVPTEATRSGSGAIYRLAQNARCLRDNGILAGFSQEDTTGMTPDTCATTCGGQGFKWLGVLNGTTCKCGRDLIAPIVAAAGTCNTPCAGNQTLSCGGPGVMRIYVDQDPNDFRDVLQPLQVDSTGQWNHTGCFIDDSSAIGSRFVNTSMSVESCTSNCLLGGFKYTGLRGGSECLCGNTKLTQRKDQSLCSTACPIGGGTCGGPAAHIDLYARTTTTNTTTAST